MNEDFIKGSVKKWFEEKDYRVLPEFGVKFNGYCRQIDVAAFRWKNDEEIEAVAVECKCLSTSREGCKEALGQATDYQLFFPYVYIATQEDKLYYADEEWILTKLGLGRLMINEKGIVKEVTYPSNELFQQNFLEEYLASQVRDKAVLFLTFCELFPDAYTMHYFGGMRKGELWVHNHPKDSVQFRVWCPAPSSDFKTTFFGINIESVYPIRNILKNMDVNYLSSVFSALPSDVTVWLGERPTKKDKWGTVILDRERESSIPIEGSMFADGAIQACELTPKQIEEEIVERSKKLNGYVHFIIDKKLWNLDETITRHECLKRMSEAKEVLNKPYQILNKWSKT